MLKFRVVKAMLRVTAAAAISLLVAFSASAQTVRYVHTDGLGSVVLTTDKNRNIVERNEYEPYGSLLNRLLTDGPGYTGQVTDASTGLTYMQQRYYDPACGCFLSADPVTAYSSQNWRQFNRYTYGYNNPYRFTDPDGRQSVGQSIDLGAEGCGPISCAVWAVMQASWKVFGAEGVSQIADKGWSNTSGGDRASAGLEIAAALPPVKLLRGVEVLAKEALPAVREAPLLLNGPINITEKGMAHVVERHTVNDVAKYSGKSKFNEGENLSSLIDSGTQQWMTRQANGNFARTWDVGRLIGVDRLTGQQTSVMSVITKPSGDLVTAFPGYP